MTSKLITVLIICYNQEDLIGRALESVLEQRLYVKSIVIFDDNSTDNTLEIVKKYREKNKNLITIIKNQTNLGIFRNIEQKWSFPVNDGLIYDLSGDDEVPNGWFSSVFNYVRDNNLDINNKKIAIYGDYQCRYPDGSSIIYKNKDVSLYKDKVRLYERGRINNRSVCYSASIKSSFIPVTKDDSYSVENVQDVQLHYFLEFAYYIPEVGNIYYSGIGVSSELSSLRQIQHEQTMVVAYRWLTSNGYSVPISDKCLPFRNIAWKRYIQSRSLKYLFLFMIYSLMSFDISLGVNRNTIRRWCFYFGKRVSVG